MRLSDTEMRKLIQNRIVWLRQKYAAAREVDGPEYTSNRQLWGRIEGEIGGLEWIIREVLK